MTFYCSVVGNYFIQFLLNYKHSQREENRQIFSSQSCFHSFSLIYETVLVFFLGAAYQSHLLHHAFATWIWSVLYLRHTRETDCHSRIYFAKMCKIITYLTTLAVSVYNSFKTLLTEVVVLLYVVQTFLDSPTYLKTYFFK